MLGNNAGGRTRGRQTVGVGVEAIVWGAGRGRNSLVLLLTIVGVFAWLLGPARLAHAEAGTAELGAPVLARLEGGVDAPGDGEIVQAGAAPPVQGWAIECGAQCATSVDEVQLYWGRKDADGILLARGLVGQPRPDIAAALNTPGSAASGFLFPEVPWRYLPIGWNQLSVYAHGPGAGWQSWSVSVYVLAQSAAPAPAEVVPQLSADAPKSRWTSGDYNILASTPLQPAFEFLAQGNYRWVLSTLTQRHVSVELVSSDRFWGRYRTGENAIDLNASLNGASREALAAVLAHETTHVGDSFDGRLRTFDQCMSSERRAAEHEAGVWSSFWGAAGKPLATNAYERELNDMVRWFASDRSGFEDWLRTQYESACSALPR